MSEKESQHPPSSPAVPPPAPSPPEPAGNPPETEEVENLERALLGEAIEEQQDLAQPDDADHAAITRDPSEPPARSGQSAPQVPAEDEETLAAREAEAGREAAEDDQADEGQRHRF